MARKTTGIQYRVVADPPNYQIGYGPNDDEFVVVAVTLSSFRARQIARLLTADEMDEAVRKDIQKESEHIQSASCQCCHGATCELHDEKDVGNQNYR